MRAPLYASPEFPNANPDLHAGLIDTALYPDVDDTFGDGDIAVVDEMPDLMATETEIEIVGDRPHSPRDSVIRLVAAAAEDFDEGLLDEVTAMSLSIPALPSIDASLLAPLFESDLDGIVLVRPAKTVSGLDQETEDAALFAAMMADSIEEFPLPESSPPPAPLTFDDAAPLESGIVAAPRPTETTDDVEEGRIEGEPEPMTFRSELVDAIAQSMVIRSEEPVPAGETDSSAPTLVAAAPSEPTLALVVDTVVDAGEAPLFSLTVDAAEPPAAALPQDAPETETATETTPASEPVVEIASEVEAMPEPQPTMVSASMPSEAEVPAPTTAGDAFAELVAVVADAAGVACDLAALTTLLSGGSTRADSAFIGLVTHGFVVVDETGNATLAPTLSPAAREWARIVRDEGGDFEICGAKTLDELFAEIAAALAGDKNRFDSLRRTLRSRGVAAYGFLSQAA